MKKDYVDLRRNEKFEKKIRIACDFHSAKYEFTQGRILNVDRSNVSFIEPHRFLIKLNGKKILVLYFDEDNMFFYNRKMPIDMRNHKFNLILAFKMDRLSRSIIDFEEFFNEIKKYGCGVESAADKGHFGGKAPLGYRHKLDETGKEKLKEWEIFEDEAIIVREIFDLCSSGNTYFQISTILKKKYNFSVIEWEDDEDRFLMDNLFKFIKIKPTSLAKKKKILGLYLKEDAAFNSQKLEVSLYH